MTTHAHTMHQPRAMFLAALRNLKRTCVVVFGFSIVLNVLMLTGSIYMLQIYDRVLPSRSEETLLALTLIVAALYGLMGVLDYARSRVSARIGATVQDRLDERPQKVPVLRQQRLHFRQPRSHLASGHGDCSVGPCRSRALAVSGGDCPRRR